MDTAGLNVDSHPVIASIFIQCQGSGYNPYDGNLSESSCQIHVLRYLFRLTIFDYRTPEVESILTIMDEVVLNKLLMYTLSVLERHVLLGHSAFQLSGNISAW